MAPHEEAPPLEHFEGNVHLPVNFLPVNLPLGQFCFRLVQISSSYLSWAS